MDDNAGYVAAGYLLTAAAVGAYVAWLRRRLRRAARAWREPGDG